MAVPRRFSASFRKLPTIFGVFSDLCGFGFTLMAGSFIFLSTTACIETDAEEIKQKKGIEASPGGCKPDDYRSANGLPRAT